MPPSTNGAPGTAAWTYPDARRLQELEAENGKLKKLLAEAHLDIHALNIALGVARDSYRNPPKTTR